jgi:two-component sensor histidine kinase
MIEPPPARDDRASDADARVRLRHLIQAGLPPNSLGAYLFAIACVAAATLLRMALGWMGGDTLLFGSYFPAILLATLMSGRMVGGFALVLSVITVWGAFIPPDFSFAPIKTNQIVSFVYFLAMGGITIAIAEGYRRLLHEFKEHELEHQLLVRELKHRGRNNLTVVQAIVTQTLRNHRTIADKINDRIRALVEADDLITQSDDQRSADFKQIVAKELAAYSPQQIAIQGASMLLPAPTARAAMLIVHELATNAAKYGALSKADGRLIVNWSAVGGRAHILWAETGGPPVAKPERHGFGLQLVNTVLANTEGIVKSEFRADGVVHEISFALPETRSPSVPIAKQSLSPKEISAA